MICPKLIRQFFAERKYIFQINIPMLFLLGSILCTFKGCQTNLASERVKPKLEPAKQIFFVGPNAQLVNSYYASSIVYPKNPNYDLIAKQAKKIWVVFNGFDGTNNFYVEIYYELFDSNAVIEQKITIKKPPDTQISSTFESIKLENENLVVFWRRELIITDGGGMIFLGVIVFISALIFLIVVLAEYYDDKKNKITDQDFDKLPERVN